MSKPLFAALLMFAIPVMAQAHGDHLKVDMHEHHVKIRTSIHTHQHTQRMISAHHIHHHWYPRPMIVRPRVYVYRPWSHPWWHYPDWHRSHVHIVAPLAYHPTRTVIVHDPVPVPVVQSQTVTTGYASTAPLTHLPANARVIQQDGKVVYQWNNVIYRYDFTQHAYVPIEEG